MAYRVWQSGVVVFSEDDRVADYRNIRSTLEAWRRWPVRQWWRHELSLIHI